MFTLAALTGPLPKLGVVAVSLLAAAALLARDSRQWAGAMLGALVLAPVLLLAEVWHSSQLSILHRHPLVVLAGGAVAVLLLLGTARCLRDRPAWIAPAAVLALPFRVPIAAGGASANLLVPLYLVVACGTLALILRERAAGPAEQRRRPGAIEWMLGIYLVLYALQSVYSPGFEKALQQTVFFYVPFTLLLCTLRTLNWNAELVKRCVQVVAVLALVLAAVGLVEYATKTLFLNPKLIAANDVHAYFTVNSVFFDPDIFGRFLALVMVLLAGKLLLERRPRQHLLVGVVLALLWGGLVLTLSRSSLGALLVGLGVLAAMRWRARRVLALSGAVVALGAVAIAISPTTFGLNQGLNNASSGRTNLVSGGITMFSQRPLWGYGSGAFVHQYRAEHPGSAQTLSASHTIPVTIAAEQGLIGELAYLALVLSCVGVLVRGARGHPVRTALAAAFLALIFHTMLYADFLEDPVTWTLLGIGIALAPAAQGQPAGRLLKTSLPRGGSPARAA